VTELPRLRPRRFLGQNFLRDPNVARKIVDAIAPSAGDTVLEIGPGEGALTRDLAARAGRLIIVDIDERVIRAMEETFADGSVMILHRDVLTLDLHDLAARYGPIRVVGNIPYNITSPILFHALDHRAAVRDVTLLMQREVARRLVAGPGTKDYGILSIMCQFVADVSVLFDVSPNVFYPRPEVTSSLVRLRMLPAPRFPVTDEVFFRTMVRGVFGKRRKTLRNSLRYILPDIPPLPDVDLQRRPEDLTLAELALLANLLVAAHAGGARTG
jgi:16S rRNA (adenine1518-N6/adenine1519-N6)-dimethyltransferase